MSPIYIFISCKTPVGVGVGVDTYFIFILENIFRKDEDEMETGICTFSPEAKLVCNKNVTNKKQKRRTTKSGQL